MERWSAEQPFEMSDWMSRARLPGEGGPCADCGASGFVDKDARTLCARCDGTGRLRAD